MIRYNKPTRESFGVDLHGQSGSQSGFTLIELLIVMAIIAAMASVILPAVGPLLRGSQLTQATQLVVDQFSLARQTALTKNRSVEVRFYQFGVADAGEQPANPNTGSYRALQLFEISDSGPVPIGKVQRLPSTIIIDSSQTLSTLITPANTVTVPTLTAAANQTVRIPGVTSYNSAAFRFVADGSTNISLPAVPWFLTLHNLTDHGQLQANFATIQVDAYNGHLRIFRP